MNLITVAGATGAVGHQVVREAHRGGVMSRWLAAAVLAMQLVSSSLVAGATSESNSAPVAGHAAKALIAYVAACAAGDQQRLARVMTDDAVIEYPLAERGSYLAVDANSTTNCWGRQLPLNVSSTVSDLMIYPTPRVDTAFLHYRVAATEHISLVTMRGERIAVLRDFVIDLENPSRQGEVMAARCDPR
jgi:hypothetical protein